MVHPTSLNEGDKPTTCFLRKSRIDWFGDGQVFEGNDLVGVKFLGHEGNRIPEWGKSARDGGDS